MESDIEPFKGLLLGLFFIAVGASIDFGLIVSSPFLIAGLVLGIIAVKFIVLFALARTFKLSLDQGLLFAFALPQVGEFTFVHFSFANQEGVLTPEITSPPTHRPTRTDLVGRSRRGAHPPRPRLGCRIAAQRVWTGSRFKTSDIKSTAKTQRTQRGEERRRGHGFQDFSG